MSKSIPSNRSGPHSIFKTRMSAPKRIFYQHEQEDPCLIKQQQPSSRQTCAYAHTEIQRYRNDSDHEGGFLISTCHDDVGHFENNTQVKPATQKFSHYLMEPVIRRNRSGNIQLMPTIHQLDARRSPSMLTSPDSIEIYEDTRSTGRGNISRNSNAKAPITGDKESEERIDSVHSNLSKTLKFHKGLSDSRAIKGPKCCHKGKWGKCRKCGGEIGSMGETNSALEKLEHRERRAFAEREATEQAMLQNLPILDQRKSDENGLLDSSASGNKAASRYKPRIGQPLTKEQRRASITRWCEGALSVFSLGSSSMAKTSYRSSIFSFWSKSDTQASSIAQKGTPPPSEQGLSIPAPRIPPLYHPGNGPPQFNHDKSSPAWMSRVTAVPPNPTIEEEQFLAAQAAEVNPYIPLRELQEQERKKRRNVFSFRETDSQAESKQRPHAYLPISDLGGSLRASKRTREELRRPETKLQERLCIAGVVRGGSASSSISMLECNELAKRREESMQMQAKTLVHYGTLLQQRQQLLTQRHRNSSTKTRSSSIRSNTSIQTQNGDLKELHKTRGRGRLDMEFTEWMRSSDVPMRYHQNHGPSSGIGSGWFFPEAKLEITRRERALSTENIRPNLTSYPTCPCPGQLSALSKAPKYVRAVSPSSLHGFHRQRNQQAVHQTQPFPGNDTKHSHVSVATPHEQCVGGAVQSLFSFTNDSTEKFHVGLSKAQPAFSPVRNRLNNIEVTPTLKSECSAIEEAQQKFHSEKSIVDGIQPHPNSERSSFNRHNWDTQIASGQLHDIPVERVWNYQAGQPDASQSNVLLNPVSHSFNFSPIRSVQRNLSTREPGTAANKLFYAHLIEPARKPDDVIAAIRPRPCTAPLQRHNCPSILEGQDFRKLHRR